MTLTIELPPEIEAGLLAQAQAQGLDVSHYGQNLVRGQVLAQATISDANRPEHELPPEEWIRAFRAWAHSHDAETFSILSDEDMSRE